MVRRVRRSSFSAQLLATRRLRRIKWQDFAAGKKSFDVSRNKAHKYMVLCQFLESLYRMYEFEQIDDAVHHALATRTHLQELRASRQMGLPERVQLFAFTIAREWNPENKGQRTRLA